MLPNIDHRELPRALQHLLARGPADEAATLPRRSFLKLAGAGGLALGAFPHLATAQSTVPARQRLKPTQQPSAFVQIATNGEVTVTINRLEFGQGVQTALPMILAEELDADWSLVRSRHGSNDAAYVDPLFGIHLTGGSHSVKNSFTQYRELGARARAMLLGAAAARWNVDVATLRTQAGTVLGPGGRKLGYGELAEAAMALPVPEKVTLKDPKDFRIIGRPTTRLDARGQEQRAAGLRYRRSPARAADGGGGPPAGVRRPPRVGGRQRGARRQGREGRAARAAGPRRRRRGRGGRWLLAGQAGTRRAEAAVGHVGRGEGRQRTATGPVPRAGRSPRRAQVRRRHGAAGHGTPATGSRVRVPLPGPRGHGAAELHRCSSPRGAPSCGPAPSAPVWTPPRRRACWASSPSR